MGNSSRQQRDARRRAMGRPQSPDDIHALIDVARRYASAAPGALGPRIAQLNQLGAASVGRAADPAALVVREVLTIIGAA